MLKNWSGMMGQSTGSGFCICLLWFTSSVTFASDGISLYLTFVICEVRMTFS